jgi:hypothetical protein
MHEWITPPLFSAAPPPCTGCIRLGVAILARSRGDMACGAVPYVDYDEVRRRGFTIVKGMIPPQLCKRLRDNTGERRLAPAREVDLDGGTQPMILRTGT